MNSKKLKWIQRNSSKFKGIQVNTEDSENPRVSSVVQIKSILELSDRHSLTSILNIKIWILDSKSATQKLHDYKVIWKSNQSNSGIFRYPNFLENSNLFEDPPFLEVLKLYGSARPSPVKHRASSFLHTPNLQEFCITTKIPVMT